MHVLGPDELGKWGRRWGQPGIGLMVCADTLDSTQLAVAAVAAAAAAATAALGKLVAVGMGSGEKG